MKLVLLVLALLILLAVASVRGSTVKFHEAWAVKLDSMYAQHQRGEWLPSDSAFNDTLTNRVVRMQRAVSKYEAAR